jgi:hypothetical protein
MRADQDEKLFERSEFLSFPLACARRGKPKAAKRQDVLSWGYPFFGQAKKGYKKSFFCIVIPAKAGIQEIK